jgi:hypothetical protein
MIKITLTGGEADMENILGLIGTIIGALGFALAVFIAIRQVKVEKINAQEQARNNRLMFLADRIFDSSIPRELRQPFYEEYISMKGNGTAVRFWQLEAEREKKLQQPA